MAYTVTYTPPGRVPVFTLPGSKSIANRAIALRHVLGASTRLIGMPECTDTLDMLRVLGGLDGTVNVGHGAAVLRTALAVAAATPGVKVTLEADPVLSSRPIAPLIGALLDLGADIKCTAPTGLMPLAVTGSQLPGGNVSIDCTQSSQFASALMMASPLMKAPLVLTIRGRASIPYIDMTAELCRNFGVAVSRNEDVIECSGVVAPPPAEFEIESDWSGAASVYAFAAIARKPIILQGVTPHYRSIQGDARCANLFRAAGVNTVYVKGETHLSPMPSTTSFDSDMIRTPDLVPAFAVALALRGVKFTLRGVANLRHKECDRIEALVEGLGTLGYRVEATHDTLSWNGAKCPRTDAVIRTFDDHRITMAFAAVAATGRTVRLDSIDNVAKSFPDYFAQMQSAGLNVEPEA